MRRIVLFLMLISLPAAAQTGFTRAYEIPVPVIENTGFGEFFAGVDFDGDGNVEIFAVNNMLDQGGAELIPRIYKFEKHGNQWDSVWSYEMFTIPQQNSWGPLLPGDWDKDGKMEAIWCPANNFNTDNTNPPRIIVFEYPGDGSDLMGAPQFGGNVPNATWTITDQDNYDLRPIRLRLTDIDNDGDEELIFGDRRGGYRFGVVSVTDIPDDGTMTLTWTMEASGVDQGLSQSTVYDAAVMDQSIILFHSDGSITKVDYANGSWTIGANIPDLVPGGSWKSSINTDIDGDGKTEVIVGSWGSTDNGKVYLLDVDVFAGFTSTVIGDFSGLIGGGRLVGGDWGDIDQDGNIDVVFGTRQATPNGAIVRMEYKGTGSYAASSSWELSVIDSLYSEDSFHRFDQVRIANVDDDVYEEVLYTDGNQTGRIPIIILDPQISTSVEEEVQIPKNFFLTQNYPNPFNPSTYIKFGLSEDADVNLRVYDMLGKFVSEIINSRRMSAGEYEVFFNAANLSSGTYIYTLTAGGKSVSKKMILVK